MPVTMKMENSSRFLLDRTQHPDDLAWEQRLAEPTRRPKLEAFLQESAAEGGDEALDLCRHESTN